MEKCSASLRRMVASGLILAFTIIPLPSAMAQETAAVDDDGLPPLPQSPIDKAQQNGTALPLSLTEVTKLALQYNLDIAIADTNEENQRLALINAYSSYDPTLSVNFSTNARTSVSTNFEQVSQGSANTTTGGQNWGASFRKQFMLTGGNLSATLSSGRSTSTAINTTNNYSGSISLSYSQPLWRNLRIDSTRNQIRLANLNIESNELDFKNRVTNVIGNIQNSYWELVSAIRNYEIQRNALRLAQRNMRDTQKKLDAGTVPAINVTNASVQALRTEGSLVQAEDTIARAQNSLRQLISSDRNSDIWKRVIIPTDMPDFVEYKIDADTAVATALRNRNEIQTSRISMTRLQWNDEVARNNKKWDISPQIQFGKSGSAFPENPCRTITGLGGSTCRTDENGNPILMYDPKYVGGPFTAYKTMINSGAYNWTVSLNVTLPLWNRTNNITIAQNEISRRQELLRLRQTEQSIQAEVMNAVQALENSRLQVRVAGESLKASREQYDGEMKRYDAGLTDNYRVLEAAQTLATTENSELTAQINYKRAIVTLQRAMNTLLEDSQFTIAKGSSANVPALK